MTKKGIITVSNMAKGALLIAVLVAAILYFTYTSPAVVVVAEPGDTVSVHYTGTLENGTEFDSSRGRSPLTFEVGAGQMIPGFDKAVEGMKVGETKKVVLQPEEAYGPRDEELIKDIPLEFIEAAGIDPKPGALVTMFVQGTGLPGRIIEANETHAIIDFNHNLAGKVLVFDIEMLSIEKKE